METIKGYRIDDASCSQTIEVRANDTQQLWFYNAPISRILPTRWTRQQAGIYGAVFLLYDSNHNPIGEYVTDQDAAVIHADEGLAEAAIILREIKAAPGYVLDPELKTIYIRYGSTTEIEWSNTAECGQIQIIKKSANDNPINGLPAGTLLEGAVFEIYDKQAMVDTIKSRPQRTRRIQDAAAVPLYRPRDQSACELPINP